MKIPLVAAFLFLMSSFSAFGAGQSISQTTPYTCRGPVNLESLEVHVNLGTAITFASGCTGRIGNLVGTTGGADCVKIQNANANAAHDLVIEGGGCTAWRKSPSWAHQDCVQVMGGARITFRNFYVGGCDTQGIFINKAGSGATTPTDVVFENVFVGRPSPAGGPATPVNVNQAIRSGIRNSTVCRSPRFGKAIVLSSYARNHGGINTGNTILPVGDPACL